MPEQLFPFLTASILLTISPGPDIVYVLIQSMVNGKKAGIITTLGLVSGILVHTSLVAFGISALINQSEHLFFIIKTIGATYLFFLAYKVWKSNSAVNFDKTAGPQKISFFLYKQGFIMNVVNPKVTIFFLAFFPGFLWESSKNIIFQFYILGVIFMLQALLIFGAVSLLADKISKYFNKNSFVEQIFKWVQILVFLGIGIFILF